MPQSEQRQSKRAMVSDMASRVGNFFANDLYEEIIGGGQAAKEQKQVDQ